MKKKTETSAASHTPTPYRITKVVSGTQWVVGKDNSCTEVFYFSALGDAIAKYRELIGDEQVVRAVNAHGALIQALDQYLQMTNDQLGVISLDDFRAIARKAIALAEGKGE